jgi:hypothetical protein
VATCSYYAGTAADAIFSPATIVAVFVAIIIIIIAFINTIKKVISLVSVNTCL